MKRPMNMLVASAMIATSVLSNTAHADLKEQSAKIKQMVEDKIKSSTLKVGAGLNLPINFGDAFQIKTGLRYQYVLDPDLGKFLREDKWKDSVEANLNLGIVGASRSIQREMSYGRFYDEWNTALHAFLFSPLDLKNINSDTLSQRMQKGDMASITLQKGTFLGLRGSSVGSVVGVEGTAGKVFTGKITTKILKRADNKVSISFANADENAIKLAGNVKIEVIPGLLKIKLLNVDEDFHLRGTADLASYTYDLNNEKAKEVLNKLLQSFDEPTILEDSDLLKEGIKLSPKMSAGIVDVRSSEEASNDITSGIVKEQKVTNNIVDGRRGKVEFKLIPGLLQSSDSKLQSINLIDMNMSGTFLSPGQYIVGYRTNETDQKNFGEKDKVHNVTSVVYMPDPVLKSNDQAKGYRGIRDLVGLSYHTESSTGSNAKEMVTYAKLCNAGIIECGGQGDASAAKPILLTVVAPQDEKHTKGQSEMNSNYFFSRGLFEKIKERMNWASSSDNQKSDAISAAISPMIHEIVLAAPQDKATGSSIQSRDQGPDAMTRRMTSFFKEVLDNDCYYNLIGLNAQNQKNWFKRMFTEKCGTNLYDISDDLVRLNMPALLLSMYEPSLLPALNNPTGGRVSAEAKAELAKYFSVSYSNSYKAVGEDMIRQINGLSYGMSREDAKSSAAQVSEFTSLINTWQEQQNLDLNQSDRMKMLKEKN